MGNVYTRRLSASSQRGIANMTAGKPAALPIALFCLFIRQLKHASGFWINNNLSTNLKHIEKKAEVVKTDMNANPSLRAVCHLHGIVSKEQWEGEYAC